MDTLIDTPVPLVTVGRRSFITTLTTSQATPWLRPVTGIPSKVLTLLLVVACIVATGTAISQMNAQRVDSFWSPAGLSALMYGAAVVFRIASALSHARGPGRGNSLAATHRDQVLAEVDPTDDSRIVVMKRTADAIHQAKKRIAAAGAWGHTNPSTGNMELTALAHCAARLAEHRVDSPRDAVQNLQLSADLDAAVHTAQQVADRLETAVLVSQHSASR